MKPIQFSIIILALLFFAFQSCTRDTVELLSPETIERITDQATEEVNLKFVFAPDNNEVWSNLIWKANGSWERNDIGEIYSNQTDWMQAIWSPNSNQLFFKFKYEVMGIPSVELWENEWCGDIEKETVDKEGDLYVIKLEVDDDFVNCLDNTGDQIKMFARLKL